MYLVTASSGELLTAMYLHNLLIAQFKMSVGTLSFSRIYSYNFTVVSYEEDFVRLSSCSQRFITRRYSSTNDEGGGGGWRSSMGELHSLTWVVVGRNCCRAIDHTRLLRVPGNLFEVSPLQHNFIVQVEQHRFMSAQVRHQPICLPSFLHEREVRCPQLHLLSLEGGERNS